jgi:hypothetical protein
MNKEDYIYCDGDTQRGHKVSDGAGNEEDKSEK